MSKLATAGKVFLGATSIAGVALGSVALTNNTSLEKQNDQPNEFIQEPQTVEELKQGYKQVTDKVEDLSEKVKLLGDMPEMMANNGEDINELTEKLTDVDTKIKENNDKLHKLNIDLSKEKKEIEDLLGNMKEFEHYDRLDGFLTRLREVTERFNSFQESINNAENLAVKAFNDSRQAYAAVQKAQGLKTFLDP